MSINAKANGSIDKLITSNDVCQGTFSWKSTHPNLKLVTGAWSAGQNEPSWICPATGTYFISGSIAGSIGYHQLQVRFEKNEIIANVGDFSETVRGLMVQATALVHLKKGERISLYVHCPTAGIELDADLWIYNLFLD